MHVYLDESGDVGWSFAHPYRNGGSSRFLCLAFIFLPHENRKAAQNLMTEMYRTYGWVREKKASQAVESQRIDFANRTLAMLKAFPAIKVDCIVTQKENVQTHLRRDGNIIYNYMCGLVVPDYVRNEEFFNFYPDKRSIRIDSGRALPHYLEIKLCFEFNSPVRLIYKPLESTQNRSLHFVDWMAYCVWSKFENGHSPAFDRLERHIRVRRLYFS